MRDASRRGGVAWPVVLWGVVLTASAAAEPPKVVKTTPASRDQQVDPGLQEIRVEFDRPMGARYSFIGGGPQYPNVTDKPRWIDTKTCVLPVQLEPGRSYRIGLNNARARGFASVDGEALEPYVLTFTTAGPQAVAPALTKEQNRLAISEINKLIRTRYSHRPTAPEGWETRLQDAAPGLEEAATPEDFAAGAAQALAAAQDFHIWLTVGGRTFRTHQPPIEPNVNPKVLSKRIPKWTEHGRALATGQFEDGVGYAIIGSWERARLGPLDPVYRTMEESNGKGLILDVRLNRGGDESLAQELAGCFVDVETVYARRATLSEGTLGPPLPAVLPPNKDCPRYRGKVAVLMGPATISSAEAFLLTMKHVANCKLVGARSFGSSGNPLEHPLGNGVSLFLPSWVVTTPQGEPIERRGIAPDVEVATASTPSAEDPVLDAALAFVRGR